MGFSLVSLPVSASRCHCATEENLKCLGNMFLFLFFTLLGYLNEGAFVCPLVKEQLVRYILFQDLGFLSSGHNNQNINKKYN